MLRGQGGTAARAGLRAYARMPSLARRAFALLAVATLTAFAVIALSRDDGATPGDDGALAAGDPFAYAPEREDEFAAAAARGHAHALYAKSPGGARASAERTARHRPLVEAVAQDTGLDADILEAIVLLESAGRPDAAADPQLEGAVGLTQILAETGRNLLGMRVDPAAARRVGRSLRARRATRGRGPRAAAVGKAPCGGRPLRPAEGPGGDGSLPGDRAPRARARRPRGRELPHGHRQPPGCAGRLRRRRRLLRPAVLRFDAAAPCEGVPPARGARRRLRDVPVARARRARDHAPVPLGPRAPRRALGAARREELRRGGPAPRDRDGDLREPVRSARRVRRRHDRRARPGHADRARDRGSTRAWASSPTASAASARRIAGCARRRSRCCRTSARG